jgi:YesN/AraC family two-component response regulator
MVVQQLFESLGQSPVHVGLGEVETVEPLLPEQLAVLRQKLVALGFELIDDVKGQLIDKIKSTVIEMIHYENPDNIKINYSTYLETMMNKDYTYLSHLFSEVTGVTIEKYIIHQKIEKVKELLVYGELTLSEIAHNLNYSSVAALSAQFKKVTGLTPKHFKQVKENKRIPLDKV